MQRITLLAQAGRLAPALAALGGDAQTAWVQQVPVQAASLADSAAATSPSTTVEAVTVLREGL
ncbi:MAG TPA: hypothetical protein VH353_06440 [Caulobacteraceae bacterium]|jgi:hypothetical protein|nr:hypothetical protein [Caulobacteraceae bacterium]